MADNMAKVSSLRVETLPDITRPFSFRMACRQADRNTCTCCFYERFRDELA
ncbi:MAG: hypothetical protein MRJ65_00025 [Candidatus Brocadiaceae bacterium]|nr:hypothetical protein [Candidatus Brocadiaceae bacterium]